MIDSYFDRADARTGYVPTPPQPRDERLWYNGKPYATNIDRNVAEARDRVAEAIQRSAVRHSIAIRSGFALSRLPKFER